MDADGLLFPLQGCSTAQSRACQLSGAAPLCCRGVGDLVLVYKRVTALAGHTSRVAELLEAVARMSAPNASSYHREVTPPAPAPQRLVLPPGGDAPCSCLLCDVKSTTAAAATSTCCLEHSIHWGLQLSAGLGHQKRIACNRHCRLGNAIAGKSPTCSARY
jgi:hypothetical protein